MAAQYLNIDAAQVRGRHDSIPSWVIYSLPDGLWLLSYLLIMQVLWNGKWHKNSTLWFLFGPVMAIGWEFAQKAKFLSGTFDATDILFYILATIIAPLICITLTQTPKT